MESVELCARVSRFLRADGAASSSAVDATTRADLKQVLADVVAFYSDGATPGEDESPARTSLAGVDDMLLMALQRLLLTTLRSCDHATQEHALAGVALLLRRCQSRLPPARVVDLLQTSVLYLPTPVAALASSATSDANAPPEELSLLVSNCLEVLLSAPSASAAVSLLTQSQENVHFLAYVVSCLLQLAERERHRGLAELAIHVLAKLLQCIEQPLVLRQFFPGVSVGMWKTMSAPLQSSKVIVAALACLSTVVSACLADGSATQRNAAQHSPPQYSLERLRDLQYGPSTPFSATGETDAWLSQSAEKVDVLLAQLLSSKWMDQQSWRVRHALVELCGVVVLECRASLHASFFRCFEELMVLRTHAIPQVAEASRDALDRLQSVLPPHEWLAMEPRFAERFHMQLSTLALECSIAHERASVHVMEILTGYLHFQRQRFQSVLDEAMPSVFKALRHVLAFESFDVDLLRHEQAQHLQGDRQDVVALPYFPKRFRHFHDESSVAAAVRLLRNLGVAATPAVVVDTAFALLQTEETENAEREAVLVALNESLRAHVGAAARSSTQDNIHLVGRILDDLLALPVWSSRRSRDKNAVALLVECVGVCVELVGGAFDGFLLYALYPLVEKLGDPAVQVEQAALTTLQRVALECGHAGDLHALFSANMDYFVDALCARLEQLDVYPGSPQVVEALLRHATVASLPLVDEITRSLLRAVDLYQQEPPATTALLRSLQLLLESFGERLDQVAGVADEAAKERTAETSPLARFLLEMKAMTDPLDDGDAGDAVSVRGAQTTSAKGAMPVEFSGTREGDSNASDASGEGAEGDDDEAELPPLPFQTQTVEILERCSYFVADTDPMACCLVLATMERGVRYLRSRPRVLLPLIHRVWPSILHRVTVSNRPILTATMALLTALAQCARDFLGDRFVETVWPSLRSLLTSIADSMASGGGSSGMPSLTRSMLLLSVDGDGHADASGGNGAGGAGAGDDEPAHSISGAARRGRVTLETKLLEATLRCLQAVAEHAVTVTSLVPDVVAVVARFLDTAFPERVVSLTQTLLLTLADLNGDEVFVAMASLAQWQPPPPPSPRFPAFRAGASSQCVVLRQPASTRPTRRASATEPLVDEQRCRANAARVLEQLAPHEPHGALMHNLCELV